MVGSHTGLQRLKIPSFCLLRLYSKIPQILLVFILDQALSLIFLLSSTLSMNLDEKGGLEALDKSP